MYIRQDSSQIFPRWSWHSLIFLFWSVNVVVFSYFVSSQFVRPDVENILLITTSGLFLSLNIEGETPIFPTRSRSSMIFGARHLAMRWLPFHGAWILGIQVMPRESSWGLRGVSGISRCQKLGGGSDGPIGPPSFFLNLDVERSLNNKTFL